MLIRTDTLQPWQGEPLPNLDAKTQETVGQNIRHPINIEELWTATELAAAGLVTAIPMVIPEGHRRVGAATYAKDGTETIPTEPIPPLTPEEIDVAKERALDRNLATMAFKVLFDQENRLRSLEGKATITAAQFRAALKAKPSLW